MALMSKSFRQMEEIVERLKRRNYERQFIFPADVWDVADAHDTVEMDKIQAEHHKKMDIMLAKTSQSSVQQLEIGTGSDD
uniref:Small terminase subunit n=1 Tax=Heterorhabditis bacteriophora TaxID=37862 RepID=A0A1I7XJN8_HETBA